MISRRRLGFLALGLFAAGRAQAEAPPRAELPIKLITLPDGARRYFVSITVGGTPIEAGLDTGSVGLRVLPGTLKPGDAQSIGRPEKIRYGSGAMLDGTAATGSIDIAGIRGDVTFEQVERVSCTPRQPDCKAASIPLADYGVMGNGIAGAGFKAILGVGPRRIAIDNPFRRLGITRFIVDLPRDADDAGRLILNPSPADVADFTAIPAYKRSPEQTQLPDDAVAGCLIDKTSGKKICGPIVFDTGAPGIRVVSPEDLGEAWPQGTQASLVLDDEDGRPLATEDMAIGSRSEATRLTFKQMDVLPKTIIRAGIAPYFAYSVLYDLDKGGLAVRRRAPRPQ